MFQSGAGFAPQTELPIGTPGSAAADGVAIADFDGDGKPDLAVLVGSNGQVYLFQNTGSATTPFSTTPVLKLNGAGGTSIVIGDFNGDGKPDIATSAASGGIAVFKNTSVGGTISFASPVNIPMTTSTYGIATADFNGDGRLDFATAGGDPGVFAVITNTSTGGNISFGAEHDFTVPNAPTDIAAGDLDGDGKADIVLVDHTNYTISVARNTMTGGVVSFAAPLVLPVGTSPVRARLADMDGDGKLDIITANHLDFGEVTTGDVFRNTSTTGSLSFAGYVTFSLAGPTNYAIDIGDMDGDGKPDIATADETNNDGLIVQNKSTPGNIVLTPGRDFGTFTTPYALAIGDFTGDGKPDMAVSNLGSPNTTSIFVNAVDPLAPYIASFTPASAGQGNTVNITGTNFTGTTSVQFGNKQAASFKVNSATSISAVVGTGSTGNITVTTPEAPGYKSGFTFFPPPSVGTVTVTASDTASKVAISGFYFTGTSKVLFDSTPASSYIASSDNSITAYTHLAKFSAITITATGGTTVYNYVPPPVINSFSPLIGPAGTPVVITGTNFTGATSVTFGGTAAASYVVNSDTQITAIVGNGTSGAVYVTTPGGTSFLNTFTYQPPPVIQSFSPVSAKPGDIVVITGTNLGHATAVSFGGTAASTFTVMSQTTINAAVYNGSSGSIAVTTPSGTSTLAGFTFDGVPTISSIFPTQAKTGATVTISGNNLGGVTAVSFGGTPAASFTRVSPTAVTAVVGLGQSGSVTVTAPGGTAQITGFTYSTAPAITAFSPSHGKNAATITITGANLSGATAVSFGGVAAKSFTVVSATTITAVVASGQTGVVAVKTPSGTVSLAGFTFDPVPVITAFSPTVAKAGATVNITGTGLSGVTSVTFGGLAAASFTIVSATSINAVVGSGQSGNVAVSAPGGIAHLAGFTFNSVPVLTSFSPTKAAIGTTVVITGTGLSGVTAVTFGAVPAASFTVVSATTINAVVGAAKDGNVAVTAPGGIAHLTGFVYLPAGLASPATDNALSATSTEKPTLLTELMQPFPNPFQNTLSINLGEKAIGRVTVELHRVSSGKLIFTKVYTSRSGVLLIDPGSIDNGLYALDVRKDTLLQKFKVIKK